MLLHLPQAMAGAMMAGSLMLFGLFHGASTYGWRGIVFFIVVCLGVSNAFENLSILTGFPFGWYHYGDKMGPRLFLVPLLIGPLYFGVGYLSWTLARAILGDADGRLAGRLVYATPIVASFIMVCWDLTIGRVGMWRGDCRFGLSVAAPFVGGAQVTLPWLRFHIPLIEPDLQIARIRLSDRTSRLRP